MASTRQYRRGSNGRFAGVGTPGTKVTQGRAGGFANAAFRSRVQEGAAARRGRSAVGKGTRKKLVGAAAGGAIVAAVAARGVKKGAAARTGNTLGKVARAVEQTVHTLGKTWQ